MIRDNIRGSRGREAVVRQLQDMVERLERLNVDTGGTRPAMALGDLQDEVHTLANLLLLSLVELP